MRAADNPREEVGHIHVSDGTRLVYTRRPTGSRRVILVCPGILLHRDSHEHRLLRDSLAPVADVVTLDIRGHGDSGGLFSWGRKEPDDVAAVARALRDQYDRVAALGFSFGGFHVTVAAARHRPFDAAAIVGTPHRLLILDHNFLTRGLLRSLPWALRRKRRLARLAPWYAGGRPVPSRLVEQVAPTPLLIAHGSDDWLIPPKHATTLFERAKEPKELLLIERGLHAEYMLVDEPAPLVEGLLAFFRNRL